MVLAAPWTSILILRGGRSTLGVWRCIFLQITLSGLRQVVTTGKLRGRRCILCNVMKIDGCFARNIDFEVADFGLHSEKENKSKKNNKNKNKNKRNNNNKNRNNKNKNKNKNNNKNNKNNNSSLFSPRARNCVRGTVKSNQIKTHPRTIEKPSNKKKKQNTSKDPPSGTLVGRRSRHGKSMASQHSVQKT